MVRVVSDCMLLMYVLYLECLTYFRLETTQQEVQLINRIIYQIFTKLQQPYLIHIHDRKTQKNNNISTSLQRH